MSTRTPEYKMPRAKSMISAPQPEAASAGAEVLRDGGNAVDAVIACALVQGVVDPLMCGIGGFGILHIYDPATDEHVIYEGLGGCPAAATEDMWAKDYLGDTTDGFGFIVKGFVNEAGPLAATSPAILKVLAQAHEKFGRKNWNSLFSEAVSTANEGWLLRPHVYTVFTQNERKYGRLNYGEKLAQTAEGSNLYLEKDGSYKKPGTLIKNPNMASTLAMIGREGIGSFYRGEIASQMLADVKRCGGILTQADLDAASSVQSAPLSIDYKGWSVATPKPPGGGQLVSQILNIAKHFDLVALGHNSPEYIRVLSEAMKVALKDREQFIGDPNFVQNPTDRLLSAEYAKECAAKIKAGVKTEIVRNVTSDSKHTTHVSAVDENGLFVSLTHTLGNPSGFVVKDLGFMLNGAMSQFDPRPGSPNSIAPGKRRLSTMSPTIVFEGKTPVMTVGAPGASWIGPGVTQVVLNVLEWGMEIQEAISAPRFVATGNAIDISNRIPKRVEQQVQALGYEVRRTHVSYAFSGVHGITNFGGVLRGGADPQRDGYAAAVAE